MKTGNRLQPLTESEINEIQGISILTETDIENVSGGLTMMGWRMPPIPPKVKEWIINTISAIATQGFYEWATSSRDKLADYSGIGTSDSTDSTYFPPDP